MIPTHDSNDVFDQYALEYDSWFVKHANLFHAEVLAIRQSLPEGKKGIEIGVGTGRFAQALQIQFGVEPSENMAKLAEERGITVYRAYGEQLPIPDQSFDFALMVTTVCFLADIPKAFSEVHRILRSEGNVILAIIDKNSDLGRKYEQNKTSNKYYKDAHFHSTDEITQLLREAGFTQFKYWQTLTHLNENAVEQPTAGYGKGSFVVIKARK